MKRQSAVVDDMTISWLEHGEGYPVVLVHGVPSSPELWRHVMPRLQNVRALAWEMVGYGGSISEGRGRNISVSCQADYLVAWMRHLGIETAILAGHDLGGGVAQIAAIRNPGLCSGLFLTNAIGYDNWPIASVKALRASGAAMRHLPNALFKLLLATFYHRGHDDSEKAQAAYDTHAPYYLRADGAAALVRQVQSLDVNDTLAVADRLKDLRIPARIVWGAADGFLKLEYGKRFARDLKAPLLTIKGGKHFTPEDHPESISQELMALVQQVRSFE